MTPARLDQRSTTTADAFRFEPLVAGGLYPGLDRGLTGEILAVHALQGRALVVCTSLVVAGRGKVTDVLEVPADSVSAQAEHLFATERPTGAFVGLAGSAATAAALFQGLGQHLQGPLVLNLTLSGPSGEDVADGRVREQLVQGMPLADTVLIDRQDAELTVGMEIQTLEDAQVAVQRLAQRGARAVVLHAGNLPARASEPPSGYVSGLLFDGEAFALFESPEVVRPALSGLHGAFGLAYLRARLLGESRERSAQTATGFVAEALRATPPEAAQLAFASLLTPDAHAAR